MHLEQMFQWSWHSITLVLTWCMIQCVRVIEMANYCSKMLPVSYWPFYLWSDPTLALRETE